MGRNDIKNAQEEFLIVTNKFKIIGADIQFNSDDDTYDINSMKLKPLYTLNEYEIFLKFLDRDYDCGYGGQQLFGVIYCEDGVWIDRGEYDGSEWWCINQYPNMSYSFTDNEIIRYKRSKKLKNIKDGQIGI
jgi:hypothetical protein